MNNIKKTKNVATFGPATCGSNWTFDILNDPKNAVENKKFYDLVKNLIQSGVTVVRLNFSHATQEEQQVRVFMVKKVSKQLNIPVSILLDTKGPEIRVGEIKNKEAKIESGSEVVIEATKKIVGTSTSFSVTDSTGTYNMANDVKPGSYILVDDGKLWLKVSKVDKNIGKITTIASNTHILKTNKRINLPGAQYSIPFLSEKDKTDIALAVKEKYDYIAASFVNNVDNIKSIRSHIATVCKENNLPLSPIKIIAKIESTDGIKNLDAIINASDGIMVARGDLGIEIPYYDVPYYQDYMVRRCRELNKPVIVATQMLDSMEKSLLPTRAETMDVFHATATGTDATMTSGETAQGLYPLETIKTMASINSAAERLFDYKQAIADFAKVKTTPAAKKVANDIAKKVLPANIGDIKKVSFPYELVVAFGLDDNAIAAISNIRPAAYVIYVTDSVDQYTRFGAYYGVSGYLVSDLKEAIKNSPKIVKDVVSIYGQGSKKCISYINGKFK